MPLAFSPGGTENPGERGLDRGAMTSSEAAEIIRTGMSVRAEVSEGGFVLGAAFEFVGFRDAAGETVGEELQEDSFGRHLWVGMFAVARRGNDGFHGIMSEPSQADCAEPLSEI